jgi:hypothetical protein
MNYGNPHRDMFVPNFPGRPTDMRRYERRERARPSFQSPLNPGGQRVDPESLYGGKPFRTMPRTISKPFSEDMLIPMQAGVDFGNRRPMYDKNGKLIQQRPVLKDTRTVPVPIMDYVGSRTAQAYKPGYPTEMDYLSDPFREIDPGSLLFPDSPYDDAEEEDMYMDYGRGPLYFG